ncbi:conserved hypothetical protein [Rippkaea orientalis PCC 8801]|uniref:Hfq-related domain-containing protein n=1 Tax=Rippkaea orientalis (strain PCC 8801 / RF-1) TaxID=41431 RepID=B7K2P7_RIPO1|nr:hypothetical protein [Rippkaea orientalis]ACK66440.1 conserved hypothetical protein [Rippkaea orientalis PCC 8801]
MAEFNTGLPSVRLVQQWIKDKKEVDVKLITNDLLVGIILWQDPQCIYLSEVSGQSTLIWRDSLVYLKPKG